MTNRSSDFNNVYRIDNKIFLTGDIKISSMEKCKRFIDDINKDYNKLTLSLTDGNSNGIMYLYINSGGGDIYASISLLDTMIKYNKSKNLMDIYTIVEGQAASAASLISVVGKKRYMTKHSDIMIHGGATYMQGWYKEGDIRVELSNLERLEKRINSLYLKYTKLKGKKNLLNSLLNNDLHFEPKECLKLGFVDKII